MAGAAVAYAVLALAFVGQSLLPGRTLSNSDNSYFNAPWTASRPADLHRPAQIGDEHDWTVQYDAWLRYSRSERPGIPLWNPYVMGGKPYIGSAQPAVFGPFTLPTLLLPYDFAVGLMGALKLFMAALGMFLLARALSLRWAGAFVAGLAFSFGMPLVTWLMEANISAVWSLIPWLMLATWHLVNRRGVLPVCSLALASTAVFTSAHPETLFQAFAGATAFLGFALVRERRRAGRGARRALIDAGRFLGGVAWGAAIAAVAVIPFIELVARSADIAERGIAVHRSLPIRDVITMMMPDWFGRGTEFIGGNQPLGRFMYFGALPLILVGIALLRPTWERVALAAFAFLCAAVVFAIHPFDSLANVLPGLSRTDNTRLVIVGLPAMALLAGHGFDDVRRRIPGPRAWVPLGLAACALAVPVALYLGLGHPLSGVRHALRLAAALGPPTTSLDTLRLASLFLWLAVAGAALVLLVLRLRGRIAPAAFATLAVLLVVADLFRAGMGFNPAIPREHATQPVTGAIRYLQSRRPARYVGIGAMPSNASLRYRLYDAGGYDFPVERRYRRLWYAQINPANEVPGYSSAIFASAITPVSLHGLGLFGVQDIMVNPLVPPLAEPGLSVAYRGPDATVYHSSTALPRAFLVAGERVVAGEDAAFAAITDLGFDGRRTLIREGAGRPVPGPGGPAGTATISRYDADRVEIAARATRASTLVLNDIWFPGWKATVDGRAAEVERVDYLFRGVRVGPGSHRVDLTYRPASWRLSLVITAIALLALILTAAGGARRLRWRR